jgi:hypothetical protein
MLFLTIRDFPTDLGKDELGLAVGVHDQHIYAVRRTPKIMTMAQNQPWQVQGDANHPALTGLLGHPHTYAQIAEAMVRAYEWYNQNPIWLPGDGWIALRATVSNLIPMGLTVAVCTAITYMIFSLMNNWIFPFAIFAFMFFILFLTLLDSKKPAELGTNTAAALSFGVALLFWTTLAFPAFLPSILKFAGR